MNYSLAFGIIVGVLIFFIAVLFLLSFFFPIIPNPFRIFYEPRESQREIPQEILDQYTAPEEGENVNIPEDVLDQYSVPLPSEEENTAPEEPRVPQDILDQYSVPN